MDYKIQTLCLFNSLFNVQCKGVQNLKMFVYHLESQKNSSKHNFKIRILENNFWRTLTYSGTKVQWKLQASGYHCLSSTLISQWVSKDMFDYIIILLPSLPAFPVRPACDYMRTIYYQVGNPPVVDCGPH